MTRIGFNAEKTYLYGSLEKCSEVKKLINRILNKII